MQRRLCAAILSLEAIAFGLATPVLISVAGVSTAMALWVGLGLTVARGFTEAMGGTLGAEATPGGGLTMTVTLPVDPTLSAPQAAAAAELVR